MNRQFGYNQKTEGTFDQFQKRLIDAVMEVKQEKKEVTQKLEQVLEESQMLQKNKMYKFCAIMMREFKYMNQLQEDKILFEVGYKDHRGEPKPHVPPEMLFDEIMSQSSQPTFTDLEAEKRRKRANSVHIFEVPKKINKKDHADLDNDKSQKLEDDSRS